MTKSFSLIKKVEDEVKNPKTPYQVFEAQLRFEKVNIVVPLSESNSFLKEILANRPVSKTELKAIAGKYQGYLE